MRQRGGQHRRQIAGFLDQRPPFGEARVLVPVEIVDQRVAFRGERRRENRFAGQGSIGVGSGRIDRGEQFRKFLVAASGVRRRRLLVVFDKLIAIGFV